MTEKLKVNLKKRADQSYDITIGHELFEKIAKDLSKKPMGHRYVLISDSNVMKLYGAKLAEVLRDHGMTVDPLAFPAGERSKGRRILRHLEDSMLELGLGRDSAVIACGGGVTGDLAGFVAAVFQRGLPYIQVPTTLLAMVDSAVGGKTGINVSQGKNLIGAFHQPKAVYADLSTLSSLPQRQFQAGMAEVVKHGMINDREFFKFLEKNVQGIQEMEPGLLEQMVKTNCAIKAGIVSEDEKEGNLRKILNYGHTLGHAIEAISEFSLLHGEAVSLGMALEGRLARDMEILPDEELERQNKLLKSLGLPVSVKLVFKGLLGRIPRAKEILGYARSDKKARAGRIEYVLPVRIGRMKQKNGQVGIAPGDPAVLRTLGRILH